MAAIEFHCNWNKDQGRKKPEYSKNSHITTQYPTRRKPEKQNTNHNLLNHTTLPPTRPEIPAHLALVTAEVISKWSP